MRRFQYSYLSVRQCPSIPRRLGAGHMFTQDGGKKKKLSPWGKKAVNIGKLGMSTVNQGGPYTSIQSKLYHVTNEIHSSPGVSIWLSKDSLLSIN